ncbi:hypothetical protein MNBD_PLANCTO03-930 [hydrothermal vent metagenome]|uniref:CcoQ/FixQ family Cbb3-type cytochrome c oxidase assembly chaperone n=1 Tax=hydrothermal vent metagenome TaxID=652676 RepID=A0A3B1DS66_9ZZZZ
MTLAETGVNSLSIYPELGLLLFFGVFVAITVQALRRPRKEVEGCARLPLDETTTGVDDTKQERGDA